MATARAILTKPLDAALGGGLALLAVGSLLVLRPGWLDALRPHHLALGALLLNYPHFVASSWLVYRSPAMVRRHRWAAVGFPLILLLLCAAAVGAAPWSRLGLEAILLATSLYLAWHYTGQAWGMVASFAALEGMPPDAGERRLVRGSIRLLLAFHVVWALRVQKEFPVFASQLNWPYVLGLGLIPVAAILGAVGFARWSRRTGSRPPARVWLPWAALLVWYAAMALHPHALHLVQLGHALQYLPFPLRVELNREAAAPPPSPLREAGPMALAWAAGAALVWLGPPWLLGVPIRQAAVPGLAAATGVGLVLVLLAFASALRPGRVVLRPFLWGALLVQAGCVLFGFLPLLFTRLSAFLGGGPGLGADAAAMLVCFVNLHHYFTDGVAWKLSNPEVRKELFAHLREGAA